MSSVVVAPAPVDLARFAGLGIRTEADLLLHLPMRYEDETRLHRIADIRPGQWAQIEGEVMRAEVTYKGRRSLLAEIQDDSGTISLKFFNFYGSQQKQLAIGNRIRAVGEVKGGLFGVELVHPRYRVVRDDTPLPQALTPVYPTVKGVSQALLRSSILSLLQHAFDETLPADLLQRLLKHLGRQQFTAGSTVSTVPTVHTALQQLHQPPAQASIEALLERSHPAWRRVIFEELLAQQLSLRRARQARLAQRANRLESDSLVTRLQAILPFQLTSAQRRCWRDMASDLAQPLPMNRLLQGDVGSGKTIVAALAAARAIGSGYQVALMAPTEILAEQHLRKLQPLLSAIGVRIGWLAGNLKEKQKREVRAALAAGDIDFLVGTHALIEDTVEFSKLALVIIDEQHRFGVNQRLALRQRQGNISHQLMMSATPIPRTLAMTYYADLDVSVIDELPPGRQPVLTKLLSAARRTELIERIRAQVQLGRQVYWVCPLIDESEALDLRNAIETHQRLGEELAPIVVGMLHGRLASAEKQAAMADFVANRIQVLVATTVIEVGVDVANATLMVIEHAERFGLAQLHQLRGRVGRGSSESVCVLLYQTPLSPTARERLKVMFESNDGFEIARRDLCLRGPGEFLGARQSGVSLLRFADLERDADLVELARDSAANMLTQHKALTERHLARWLGAREEFLKA